MSFTVGPKRVRVLHALTESILDGGASLVSLLTSASSSEQVSPIPDFLPPLSHSAWGPPQTHHAPRVRPLLCVLAFLSALAPSAKADQATRQDGESSEDQEFKAEAPDRPSDMPLAQLPEAPSIRLGAPRPEAIEAIDLLLDRLVSEQSVIRERASRSLLEAKQDWVAGISRRIDRIAERANRSGMKSVLKSAREGARDELSDDQDASASDDYLIALLAHAAPESQDWRDLTQLMALNRMLSAIGTTDAVREIIRIYVRFGDLMRIDCQRQLESLGDRSIAGLLEAQRHPAPAIAEWAKKRLALRDKLTPHLAVRTDDERALADILVALGRARDPESTSLLISFAGTEKAQVRQAARQAIGLLGDVGAWQLKDAYQNTTGKTPPRDWTWKRTARELFTEFDRLRLEGLYRAFSDAQAAGKSGDLAEMAKSYDAILLRSPQFDRKEEMAPGYLAYAKSISESDPDSATLALRRCERVADDDLTAAPCRGLRKMIEAKKLRELGIIDQVLVEQSATQAPESADQAREVLEIGALQTGWGRSSRYLVAGAVAAVALLGAAWILFSGWLKRRHVSTAIRERAPNRPIQANAAEQSSEASPSETSPKTAVADEPNKKEEAQSDD